MRDGIYPWPNAYVYPLIFMQKDTRIKNLKITDLYRKEYNIPVETIHIGEKTMVDNLILDNIVAENHTGEEMPMLVNNGSVKRFVTNNIMNKGEV